MFTIRLNKTKYTFFGKQRGANTNKFNRATKLLSMYAEIEKKMDGYIDRGSNNVSHQMRCALCVKMLMHTGIRIGNESSAEGYTTIPHPHSKVEPKFVQTYGLTTITWQHVQYKRGKFYFNFLGKKQVENSFVVEDKTLVRQLKIWWDATIPTDTFFEVSVRELSQFIKRSVGKQFTPKDFRTMRANMYAWEAVQQLPKELPKLKRDLNAEVKSIACYVSEKLNNTPGVCKKSYIDDMLFSHVIEVRTK